MKRLVLVGAGHAHAIVLREWAQRRPENVEVVLISPVVLAPYSGMIPGWLAGCYRWEECCIDFAGLCHRAGVALVIDTVVELDAERMVLSLASGKTVRYDWLSLNIGATLIPPDGNPSTLPMRPLSELRSRWEKLQQTIAALPNAAHFQIATVGGGAAGVETMLAVSHSLRQLSPEVSFRFTLVTDRAALLPDMTAGAARRLRRHLDAQGIEVVNNFRVMQLAAGTISADDGRSLPADAVLWATGAQAYPWLRQSGLGVDDSGFVAVDSTLRSRSHNHVFATGDCAGWEPPLPKAGVFSVRMGPTLVYNLLATIAGHALQPYVPQRHQLALIGTGDKYAVAAWWKFSCGGHWVWRWKRAIDKRFLASCHKE